MSNPGRLAGTPVPSVDAGATSRPVETPRDLNCPRLPGAPDGGAHQDALRIARALFLGALVRGWHSL